MKNHDLLSGFVAEQLHFIVNFCPISGILSHADVFTLKNALFPIDCFRFVGASVIIPYPENEYVLDDFGIIDVACTVIMTFLNTQYADCDNLGLHLIWNKIIPIIKNNEQVSARFM